MSNFRCLTTLLWKLYSRKNISW